MTTKRRYLYLAGLLSYFMALIKLLVFKDVPTIKIGFLMLRLGGSEVGHPNLVPFKTILSYLTGERGVLIGGINLIGNIVLLVPVGVLASLVYPSITWKQALALACASGLLLEGMQVLLGVGIFDIDDIILNGFGVMLGYWVSSFMGVRQSTGTYLKAS